jgi:hypothetical protein
MPVRLLIASKLNPFTLPGLLFNAPEEGGGGGTDDKAGADKAAADKVAADKAAAEKAAADKAAADAADGGDPAAKLVAAQKVNDDLERKLKRSEDNRAKVGELEKSNAALQAKIDGKEAEHTAAVESQRVKDEALAGANARILKAEVRAAATGKLADPADALQFLDLSAIEVSADGEVDSDEVAAAIDDLISKKPYLGVKDDQRFKGDGDGGTRKESSKSIDDQIAEATKAGNFQLVIALREQQHANAAKS